MSDGMPENLLTVWARLLFDSLAHAGVRDVVVSPGSRSTPFVLAACAHPALRVHDAIDERTAAFFSLGQARVTGAPSVLLCTSGSAGANYLPAVIEADQSGVPLVVVTADRPAELLHVSANQTIDQRLLFEGFARRVVDVGAPDASPGALRGLRRLAAQAVALACGPSPGAVHLNLRARKPLEAVEASSPAGQALRTLALEIAAEPAVVVTQGRPVAPREAIGRLAVRIRSARRGVIVAGPAPAAQRRDRDAIARLARAAGFPLLAEAASQLRFTGRAGGLEGVEVIDAFEWLYASPPAELVPDLVVQLGAPPTSGAWERLLDRSPRIDRIVIAPTGWPDPHASAREIVHADVADTCERLARELAGEGAPHGETSGAGQGAAGAADEGAARADRAAFARALSRANARVHRAIDARLDGADPALGERAIEESALGESALGEAALGEAALARCVVSGLPDGAWLALGNSLPIRTVDAWCGSAAADVGVLAQRGASGIEGLVSGAAGASSVARAPVVLLVGDVSALHDVGGFGLAAAASRPLAIVIVDNRGGRIFEQLPVARGADDATMRRFTTPHEHDFEHLARLYGCRFARVRTVAQAASALEAALAHDGCTLIDAVVPPSGAAREQAAVSEALARG